MVFERRAVGIDLGTRTVKAVELRASGQGFVVTQILRVDRAELCDPGSPPAELAKGLRQRLAQARISPRGVVLGLGGPDTLIRYTRVPHAPPWRLKVIVEFEVGEIAEKMGESLSSDYRVLQIPREPEEDETLLIAMAKERPLSELLDAFETEGITVDHAVHAPLALFRAHDAFGEKAGTEPEDSDDLCLLADLGEENLCLALVLNGRLLFARSATFGGRSFTQTIADELKMQFAEAEDLKVARGGLSEREPGVSPKLIPPLRSAASQLFGIIQSFPRISATQTRVKLPPLTRISLFGGGMRLRGVDEFLSKGLDRPAEAFRPTGLGVSASLGPTGSKDLDESGSEFGVALGLAAGGLSPGAVERLRRKEPAREPLVSVLPAKYRKRREFRDRTLFLYAAGAILVLVLAIRLAQVLVRTGGASSVHSELRSTFASLEGKRKELEGMERQVAVRKVRLNRVLREAEQTSFQAYLLDLLARVLRPEMQLSSFALRTSEETEDGTSIDYAVAIRCRVSDEKRQASQWIRELQGALESDERIGSVETTSSSTDGVWRMYELLLRPSYVTY